jgi:hypothetical protein
MGGRARILAWIVCLVALSGFAPRASADPSSGFAFLAGAALPRAVYYGDCGLDLPSVVTFQSNFTSSTTLRVTSRYDYVAFDPRLPESTILAAPMTQVSSLTYRGSVDVGAEAFPYLRGGDGIMRYSVSAIDAYGAAVAGASGTIAVYACQRLSEK